MGKKKRKNSADNTTTSTAPAPPNSEKNHDKYGEFLTKDVYGTKVSVETEEDQFKVAERVGKMRGMNSDSICASDYEMKRKWSSAWNTGFIGTIGIRKSTGGPAPKRGFETLSSSSQLK